MLQDAIDLQQKAVNELVRKTNSKNELTFRAPTGSGKTRMMADFMNRILAQNESVIFLVSTLSKGNLAEQNYNVFKDCADKGIFSHLKPHLISTEIVGEESLFIPLDHNVYVLPRDLYKKGGRLMQGAMEGFLRKMTANLFGLGLNKQIYLIKDECHQATNNLDSISASYFEKVVNFSATPNLKRGQTPDVEITDEDAMNAKLIKTVELDDESDCPENERGRHPEKSIRKFMEIKTNYRNLLGVNPCLIIQISNKDKAEDEWRNIEAWLNQPEFQSLKWMLIVNDPKKCLTNDKVNKLKVERWKDYAKENASTIDVIVFKMVISEGWDIPRACMLYQVRDTKSKQLDEQVMGRVRRNPRLVDFETLSADAQNLAMTAWVWGIEPQGAKRSRQVCLFGSETDIPQAIKIRITRLKPLTEHRDFDVAKFINEKTRNDVVHISIFDIYAKMLRCENEVLNLCYEYADSVQKWWKFGEHIDAVRKEYDNYICNYDESMEIVTDTDGNAKEVSFPITSMYMDNEHYQNISDWVWRRKDGRDKFSFDSEAEREWANVLKDLAQKEIEEVEVGQPNPLFGQMRTDGTIEPRLINSSNRYLWGKNFLQNSEIKFEYYLNGLHFSYPDFVMKDKKGRIHLFEVKSVNVSNSTQFDSEEYKAKINALKACYKRCSELTDYIFYLPVMKDDEWHIARFKGGDSDVIGKNTFVSSLR